jgi:radical SAM protein with 4Fe4S-binding SPASM domain
MITKCDLQLPRVLRIEPSSVCNLACTHCPTGTVKIDRCIMSSDVFNNILSSIKSFGQNIQVVVMYHGGEPFLNANLPIMISEIRKILPNSFIKTVSNGMLLTKEKSRIVINSGLDLIEFSLDGNSQKESEYVRFKSKTDIILKNVHDFIETKNILKLKNPNVAISTTQFVCNEEDLLINKPIVPRWLINEFGSSVEYKVTYAIRWPHMNIIKKNGKEIYDMVISKNKLSVDVCDHVNSTITVRSDGSVVPCCYDLTTMLPMGNILNNNLKDIWNNSLYQDLRDSFRKKDYFFLCKSCAIVQDPQYLRPTWNRFSL